MSDTNARRRDSFGEQLGEVVYKNIKRVRGAPGHNGLMHLPHAAAQLRLRPDSLLFCLIDQLQNAVDLGAFLRRGSAAHLEPQMKGHPLFALANMAASDAFVAVFDAKYAFNFWRPVTAIRNGDSDGNDATAGDPAWLPFVDTPMHPEYPCAHCITAGAVATVLEAEFGTGRVPVITMTSTTAPGVTHRWERIADYVKEVDNARVWGGIHYRNSTEVGERMGRAIGNLVVTTVLQRAQ